jgi:hypothetical protein
MRWGKIILLFQAIITLILGVIFFSQVFGMNTEKIIQTEITMDTPPESMTDMLEIPKQYPTSAYILLFVSLIELIIITRLLT